MSTEIKTLIPNKSWILKEGDRKLGTVNKEKKGFNFFVKGRKIFIKKQELGQKLGVDLPENQIISPPQVNNLIYNFPCASRPYSPVYNIKKRLPIYSKSNKSKSLYCAGYYIIQFRKGWVKSFCPKLITLDRYPFHGPFKTEEEMKAQLSIINKGKNESYKYASN